jgi:ABC-type nitrate/sulfonate/bicarbonate transport system substrate-binding protein
VRSILQERPDLVERVVQAFVRGAEHVRAQPDESAEIAAKYIGFHSRFIRKALDVNRPDVEAIRNDAAMKQILKLMMEMGYIDRQPTDFTSLGFLERALAGSHRH